jgi:hypothetical protein
MIKAYCVFSSTAYPITWHLQVIFNNEKAAQNLVNKKEGQGWRYEKFEVFDSIKNYYLRDYDKEI